MNTKTMRLPPRRVLTPSVSPNNNKRKEREEGFERPKPSPASNTPTTINPTKSLKPDKPRAGFQPPRSSRKGSEPTSSNHLLAGFLAHEFLTKGTLFGESWDPSRAAESSQKRETEPEKEERYAELADLLRASGTHVPGIVNPTQLSRFIHL